MAKSNRLTTTAEKYFSLSMLPVIVVLLVSMLAFKNSIHSFMQMALNYLAFLAISLGHKSPATPKKFRNFVVPVMK